MNELLNELQALCNIYKGIAENLCKDDDEEFYADADDAIADGRGQAFWEVHIDLNKIIERYKGAEK